VLSLRDNLYYAEEAFGRSHVQYKSVRDGSIGVSGLPEGLSFKKPSSYGRRDLHAILQGSNDLKFTSKYIYLVFAP
jgi:GTF2I-like repeat